MNLVASVICKNELGRYLEPCINHLLDFCDQVVVLDDGSSDGTADWLYDRAETDDRLQVQFLAASDGFFEGHEGRKRQELLKFTMAHQPTHILAIDADEFVANGQALRVFCETGRPVGTLVMQEIWGIHHDRLDVRMDGGWRPHPIPILFQAPTRLDDRHWRIQDRALACGREPIAVKRMAGRGRPTGTEILHFGWANRATRQERYDRYAVADGGRFHQNAHLESILWDDDRVKLSARKWPEWLREAMW